MNRPPDHLHGMFLDLVRLAGQLHPEGETSAGWLPLPQIFALHELDTDAPMSQRDLAGRLGLEKSTVSRLVADLERGGFVVRQRDPANRRFYQVRITDRGREKHRSMAGRFHERYERVLSGMTETEREALLIGLPALIRVLRDELDGRQ